MAGVSRARIKPPGKTQAERDARALGVIETYMDAVVSGHLNCTSCKKDFSVNEISPAVVSLLKARYDKLRPSLSAVEQHMIDDTPIEQDIITTLKGVLERDPGLRTQLKALILGMPAAVEQPEIATKAA